MKKELLRGLEVIGAGFIIFPCHALFILARQIQFDITNGSELVASLMIIIGSLGFAFLPPRIWNNLKQMKPRSRAWLLGGVLLVYLYDPTPTLTLKEEAFIQKFVSNRLNTDRFNDRLEEDPDVPISDLVKLKMLMVKLRVPQSSHISIDESDGYWTLYFSHYMRVLVSTKIKECYITTQIDKNWVIEHYAGKVQHYTKRDALFVVKHKSSFMD